MPGGRFYRTSAWAEVRLVVLRRDAYRCASPRCTNRASHVDHKVPIARGGAGLDPRNLQSLCASCHSRKTARTDGGFGHAKRDAREWGCDAEGWPLDPEHVWRAPKG